MIFVTGGTGLVGRHVLLELRDRGIPTTALARTPAAAESVRQSGAVPFEGSVEDPALWSRVGDCSAIIHCAAVITSRAPWEHFRQVNVESTRLAADRARRLGIPLIHLSSVAVYSGDDRAGPEGSLDESRAMGPLDDKASYPRSKRLAETVLWDASEAGLKALALRPCLIYGEGDRQFLPRLLRIARKGWLPLIGDGDRPLSLVHARNVAHAAAEALVLDRGWGRAYNVVNEDSITSRELLTIIATEMNRPIRTVRIPYPLAIGMARVGDVILKALLPELIATGPSGAIRYWRGGNPFNTAALRSDLAWVPPVRHREGIPLAVRAAMSG